MKRKFYISFKTIFVFFMWEMEAVLPALAWTSVHCPYSFFSLHLMYIIKSFMSFFLVILREVGFYFSLSRVYFRLVWNSC